MTRISRPTSEFFQSAVVSLDSTAGKVDVRPRPHGFPRAKKNFPRKPTDVTVYSDVPEGAKVNPDDAAGNKRSFSHQSWECPTDVDKFDMKFMNRQVVAFNTENVRLTGTYYRETGFWKRTDKYDEAGLGMDREFSLIKYIKSPRKLYKRQKKCSEMDDFDADAVRRTVHSFYDKGEYPTAY